MGALARGAAWAGNGGEAFRQIGNLMHMTNGSGNVVGRMQGLEELLDEILPTGEAKDMDD